ncbi:mesenchyme-specific cell surface glycoprotein-like isoform X1 [Haliotis rufescens]|uniref:mesenchyme-specific cell surface glycoprotein-like isoform X1 n=2 Tax=Haliotis rufescens TaxID=6454 RepID=UPI00201E7DEB|nr:mesenchyme-specific cell surface glycoprotein-like isoform X1 [Haliotis rufescens]
MELLARLKMPAKRLYSSVLVTLVFIGQCLSRDQLRLLSYTKLASYPDPAHLAPVYRLHGGAAAAGAYDADGHVLYVIGDVSPVVHVLDLSDPGSPHLLVDHLFTPTQGQPRGVDVCGGELAIVMASSSDVYEGHVMFYKTYSQDVKKLWYLRTVPVGSSPSHVLYSRDCKTLVVTNEGVPGKDASNKFVDPEGSVTILRKDRTDTWSEQTSDFKKFNGRSDIRHPSACVNTTTSAANSSLSQDLQPSYSSISPDGHTVFVSLQDNNAIARVSVREGEVTGIYSLGAKNWNQSRLDPSDQDGGPNLAMYPIYGMYQPRAMKLLQRGSRAYLVTADEGRIREYSVGRHGFSWSEAAAASVGSLPAGIQNNTLADMLRRPDKLGRLLISKCDVISPGIHNIKAFGGRGFSIWDTSHLTHGPVYNSGGEVEEVNQLLLDNVFNTDVTSSVTSSPENMRDASSKDFGPKLSALDVVEDNGKTYLVLGSHTMGSLYLYTVDMGSLTTDLNHVYRQGGTRQTMQDMYRQGTAGDVGISDIRLISSRQTPANKTLAVVISNGSGTVSVYEIEPS